MSGLLELIHDGTSYANILQISKILKSQQSVVGDPIESF